MSLTDMGRGPIRTNPFFVNLTAQSTTPVRVLMQEQAANGATFINATPPVHKFCRATISNLHATNQIAFCITSADATAPLVYNSTSGGTSASPTTPVGGTAGLPVTMTCGVTGALGLADGIRIRPNNSFDIDIGVNQMLWIVASAASTPVQVVWFCQGY